MLSEWLGLKYTAWIGVNVWFLFKEAPLTEVFLINGLIAIIHIATKIHSTAIGIMVQWRDEPLPTPKGTPKDWVLFPPRDKQDIN